MRGLIIQNFWNVTLSCTKMTIVTKMYLKNKKNKNFFKNIKIPEIL